MKEPFDRSKYFFTLSLNNLLAIYIEYAKEQILSEIDVHKCFICKLEPAKPANSYMITRPSNMELDGFLKYCSDFTKKINGDVIIHCITTENLGLITAANKTTKVSIKVELTDRIPVTFVEERKQYEIYSVAP